MRTNAGTDKSAAHWRAWVVLKDWRAALSSNVLVNEHYDPWNYENTTALNFAILLSPYIFDWPNLMNGKSHKQSITEKRLFAILPKSYNYVYFLWKNL